MRRRSARVMTLVLIVGLAVLCCACLQLGEHRCDHGPRCPICECVKLGLRGAALAALCLLARGPVPAHAAPIVPPFRAGHFQTPIEQKVRLND